MWPACDGRCRLGCVLWLGSSASGLGRGNGWWRVGIGFLGDADQAASRAAQVRRVGRWDGARALL